MQRAPHPLLASWRRLVDRASALDAAPDGTAEAALADVIVGTWGAARLLAIAPISPLVAAAMAVEALRATAATSRLIERFPATIDRVLRGGTAEQPDLPGRPLRVARRPAGERYVITSDLHRCMAGGLDWPRSQQTDVVLLAAMRQYAAEGWTIVENGDVEDFWLTGGSVYGVTYDVGRIVANLLPADARAEVLPEIYGDHLDRIVDNNRELYDLMARELTGGRYLRLTGNHDDVYLDDRVVARLRRHVPHAEVADVLALSDGDHPVGAVLHGHQTDSWNLPGRDWLGKFCTWLASALVDAPLVRITPGMPDVEQAAALFADGLPDRLTAVGRRLGVNLDMYSLDEVRLLDSWRRWFGGGPGPGTSEGPRLVLGHTHVPLVDPLVPGVEPDSASPSWERYTNGGCGVLWQTVTCVEWDGTSDASDPSVTLVAWRLDPDDPSRAVREELVRPPGSPRLQVRRDEARTEVLT